MLRYSLLIVLCSCVTIHAQLSIPRINEFPILRPSNGQAAAPFCLTIEIANNTNTLYYITELFSTIIEEFEITPEIYRNGPSGFPFGAIVRPSIQEVKPGSSYRCTFFLYLLNRTPDKLEYSWKSPVKYFSQNNPAIITDTIYFKAKVGGNNTPFTTGISIQDYYFCPDLLLPYVREIVTLHNPGKRTIILDSIHTESTDTSKIWPEGPARRSYGNEPNNLPLAKLPYTLDSGMQMGMRFFYVADPKPQRYKAVGYATFFAHYKDNPAETIILKDSLTLGVATHPYPLYYYAPLGDVDAPIGKSAGFMIFQNVCSPGYILDSVAFIGGWQPGELTAPAPDSGVFPYLFTDAKGRTTRAVFTPRRTGITDGLIAAYYRDPNGKTGISYSTLITRGLTATSASDDIPFESSPGCTIFPQPANEYISIHQAPFNASIYRIRTSLGTIVCQSTMPTISLPAFLSSGLYCLEILDELNKILESKLFIIVH